MGEAPYRSVEGPVAEREDERVEVGDHQSFAGGEVCRACGANGARPARPAFAKDYRCEDGDEHEPAGRIALCAGCADVARVSNERERALAALSLASVGAGLLAVFVPSEPSLARVFAVMFASALAGWLIDRAIVQRLAVRALVLSVRGTQMRVWLARTSAAKMPLRAPRNRRWEFALVLAMSCAAMPGLWIAANPRIEVENVLRGPVTMVVNRARAADLSNTAGGYIRLPYGINRLEFVTEHEIPPLELRGWWLDMATVRLALPACDATDAHGDQRPFRYAWRRPSGSFVLDCEYTR